jgi:hypothetical protein
MISSILSLQQQAPVNRSYTRTNQAELSFNTTYDFEVFNAIYDIKSNAIGMDGIPSKIHQNFNAFYTAGRTSLTFFTRFLLHPSFQRHGRHQRLCQ